MQTRAAHFPRFDALRGIAAVCVLSYHALYQPALARGVGEAWWPFVSHFDIAVPIFLGISGFLLYRPFVAARMGGRPVPSLRRYGLRRVLRIVPGYWFALTAIALWFWANPPGFADVRDLDKTWRFYGFLQVYDADTVIGGIGQAWTLCVEVTFYLALPLWILLARRFTLRTELLGLAGLVVFSLAWKAWVLSRVDPTTLESLPALLPMPTWIDHLVLGMGAAALSVRFPDGPRRLWPFWAGALALFLVVSLVVGPDGSVTDPLTDGVYWTRHVFYGAIVACLLAVTIWGRSRVLLWPPVAFIGVISFSFYLWHLAWLRQQEAWFGLPDSDVGWVLWTAGGLAGSALLGSLGYFLVERPFMNWRRGSRGGSHPRASTG